MAKILVVDDRPANRDLLVTLLGYRDHAVTTACDGIEGLAVARSQRPDLIITDIVMPGMDGYELLREVRHDPLLARTRVIFHTANYLETEVRRLAEIAGVSHVLSADGDPQRILSTVEDALATDNLAEPAPDEEFQKRHLRSLSAKLVEKVRELEGTQAALRESEGRFRSLSESSPMGVFSMTPDGVIDYANPRLREIVDASGAGAPMRWCDFIEPADVERFRPQIEETLRTDTPFRSRVRILRPGGEHRWAEIHAAAMLDDRGAASAYVGTVEDVTDLVDAQQQQEALEARLRTSERLESLGQLSAGIAHDFNNLLAVMLNYAAVVGEEVDRMIAESERDERLSEMRSDVAEIAGAAERAAELTNQLLIFGRREIVHPQVIDANALVKDMQRLLSRTIGEHVVLNLRLHPALWAVEADQTRLEQVVLNLVVNGRDAIADTGTVVVATENVVVDDETAALHAGVTPGQYVKLSVADTGDGMRPDVVARAFEPFFTTKPKGMGTGLGLATVYGIVSQLGGRVAIFSEPGQGTTVHLYIPAAAGASVSPPAPAAIPSVGFGQTILVVEDEAALRAVIVRILARNGYEVMTAARGAAALTLAREHAKRIDLVLTDVVMPEMSGAELATRLAATGLTIPVVYMSGYADGLLGPSAPLPEGVTLIGKPFTQTSLLNAVAAVLGETGRLVS